MFPNEYAATISLKTRLIMMNEAKKKQIESCNKFLDSHRWLSIWDLN